MNENGTRGTPFEDTVRTFVGVQNIVNYKALLMWTNNDVPEMDDEKLCQRNQCRRCIYRT